VVLVVDLDIGVVLGADFDVRHTCSFRIRAPAGQVPAKL
jgi:hypothetical protein